MQTVHGQGLYFRRKEGENMISSFLYGLAAGMLHAVAIRECAMRILEARDEKLNNKRRKGNEESSDRHKN